MSDRLFYSMLHVIVVSLRTVKHPGHFSLRMQDNAMKTPGNHLCTAHRIEENTAQQESFLT
jgi:hypothetical protein